MPETLLQHVAMPSEDSVSGNISWTQVRVAYCANEAIDVSFNDSLGAC